jgi:Family of unknown function (DUF6069)
VTPPLPDPGRRVPAVDAGQLWAGGVATALVAALIAVVGVLIGEGALDLTMVHPPLLAVGGSFAVEYAVTAAVFALVATGAAHLLAVSTPRPGTFLSWLVGLVTAAGVVLPFTLDGSFGGQLATAVTDLVIGLAVLSLLTAVMTRTVHLRGPRPPAPTF